MLYSALTIGVEGQPQVLGATLGLFNFYKHIFLYDFDGSFLERSVIFDIGKDLEVESQNKLPLSGLTLAHKENPVARGRMVEHLRWQLGQCSYELISSIEVVS